MSCAGPLSAGCALPYQGYAPENFGPVDAYGVPSAIDGQAAFGPGSAHLDFYLSGRNGDTYAPLPSGLTPIPSMPAADDIVW